jgi:hypothetical protein
VGSTKAGLCNLITRGKNKAMTNARKLICKNIGKNQNNFATQEHKYLRYKTDKKYLIFRYGHSALCRYQILA